MCGIAAIFAYHPDAPGVDESELTAIRDHMSARGPDAAGLWMDARRRIGLGHRRLAIIDLSAAGQQPMHLTAAGLSIVFNGEIYNYRELRAGLEASGCEFQSHSDTEVLLHLYRRDGPGMVKQLRGMYAFAIWDAPRAGLFVARDPYGIKPLYFADDGKTLRVASQVRALLAGGKIGRTPEPAGHVGFFLWGHIPEPFTLFQEIRAVPAGSTLWLDARGHRREEVFCAIPELLRTAAGPGVPAGGATGAAGLAAALRDSVAHHLIADVPVGIFLSAGLDSTTLTALTAETGADVRTVTLGFAEYRGSPNDEVTLAETVARQYGARHQTVWVGRADFQTHHDRLFAAMDQPSIDGVNTYFVSLAAQRAGLKVVLSGLGGDELFGGYPSFAQLPRMVAAGRLFGGGLQPVGRGFRMISAPLLKRCTSPKYAGLLEYGSTYGGAYLLRRGLFMPWELPEILDPDLVRAGWERLNPLAQLASTADALTRDHLKIVALESCWYMRNQLLRDSDWASMAHSLELRVPLVDAALLRALLPALGSDTPPTKRDMAAAPRSQLPAAVLHRPKTGFQIPVRDWLRAEPEPGGRPAVGRGLRAWAEYVYSRMADHPLLLRRCRRGMGRGAVPPREAQATVGDSVKSRHVLALVSDAYGGHGGIAKFNRDLLGALCGLSEVSAVTALPRIIPEAIEALPAKLTYVTRASRGKLSYGWEVLRQARREETPDVIICGHINLLPLALLARRQLGRRNSGNACRRHCPVVLIIHGIDAWQPTGRRADRLVKHVDRVVAVSAVTARRFCEWSEFPWERVSILPNSFDPGRFCPGPKNPALVARYGLAGKTVLLTVGRLASLERYKGFDEVLEVLPTLLPRRPDLVYLIVGDGNDRARLEAKARALGLEDKVVFAGKIPESEKVDHYRLADVYVMPSRGEGFGIVYLEALACGIPVIGSRVDGGREALRDGQLGQLVNPGDRAEIMTAILAALHQPRGQVLPGLEYFSYSQFESRCRSLFDSVCHE